jgi:hypothetical protein
VLAASIIIALTEAASTSEMSVNIYQTTTQKTAIFILAAMRTLNLNHQITPKIKKDHSMNLGFSDESEIFPFRQH